jgi:hypothetical protein
MTEPAAGWYRDPAGGSAWRWWDGATWTEHVRANEQPFAAVPAPAPTTAGVAVPGAAAIPVTDQMYWHSASAEVIEVPRLPHHTVSGDVGGPGRGVPGYVRDWQDLGSPQTAGIWLLAFANLAASGVVLGLSWVFAYFDQRSLGARGYHPPSIWWMLLLPPLAYFIARGRSVRRESMRAWPPELLYVATVLLIMAAMFLSAYSVAVQAGTLPPIG